MKVRVWLLTTLIVAFAIYSNSSVARGHGGGGGHHGGHGGWHGGGGHLGGHGGWHGDGGHHGGHRGWYGGGGGWRGHSRGGYYGYSNFGFYFGAPYYWYPYYGYSYPYYYPQVMTVPSTPPVYIQQPTITTQQYPPGYWYYCQNPAGYYPTVSECPTGWQQVSPTPTQ